MPFALMDSPDGNQTGRNLVVSESASKFVTCLRKEGGLPLAFDEAESCKQLKICCASYNLWNWLL